MTGANVADAQVSISDSTINEVKLADQEGFAGNVTIKNSTITSVYGAASGAVNDLTAGNTIKTVYAENNGASIKLGSSAVGVYVAGLSSDSAARETLEFNDAINAGTLIIGDASVDNSGDEPAINGVANTIGKIAQIVIAKRFVQVLSGAIGIPLCKRFINLVVPRCDKRLDSVCQAFTHALVKLPCPRIRQHKPSLGDACLELFFNKHGSAVFIHDAYANATCIFIKRMHERLHIGGLEVFIYEFLDIGRLAAAIKEVLRLLIADVTELAAVIKLGDLVATATCDLQCNYLHFCFFLQRSALFLLERLGAASERTTRDFGALRETHFLERRATRKGVFGNRLDACGQLDCLQGRAIAESPVDNLHG
jgi:hypothetical protein